MFVRHAGIPCALPAGQIERVERATDEPLICLWGRAERADSAEPADAERALLLRTAAGPRWVRCETARFGELEEDRLLATSDLLAELLGLPHVVGATETDGDWIWLVDLQRYAEPLGGARSE
jgi:hypothetical protein